MYYRANIKEISIAILLLGLVALIFCIPIFKNFNYWGANDGDQFLFWNTLPRISILKYHQFPLWNPYTHGGNVLLAHPHSPFLSPFYIPVLVFGAVAGLKINIVVYLFMGMLGMYLLSKHLKTEKVSAYFAPLVFILSSVHCLYISHGNVDWVCMAFIPWVFLYYLKSLENKRYILIGIVFLSLIFLSGSVDIFPITVIFLVIYSLFILIKQKGLVAFKVLVFLFSGTFLLCSIKILPMLEFLHRYPRFTSGGGGATFDALYAMMLSRSQAILNNLSEDALRIRYGISARWHEYGAYIGILPLLLYIIGITINFKKNWPLIMSGLLFLLITLGEYSPINLWKHLHLLPVYNQLSEPSRYRVIFIFIVSIIGGLTLSKAEKSLTGRILISAIILFTGLDLFLVNRPILKSAFSVAPINIKEYAKFCQRYDYMPFYKDMDSFMHPLLLSNSGVINAYEVVHLPEGDIRTKYQDIAWLKNWIITESKPEGDVAYALTRVHSSITQSCQMRLKVNHTVRLWVNNKEVEKMNREGNDTSVVTFYFELKGGWNKILFKFYRLRPDMLIKRFASIVNRIEGFPQEEFAYDPYGKNKNRHFVVNPDYKGEAYLVKDKEGKVEIVYFSPNKFIIKVDTRQDDRLVLNQNYHTGWRIKGSHKPVDKYKGLISARVGPADSEITFYYLPTSFLVGALISSLTLIYLVILILKYK